MFQLGLKNDFWLIIQKKKKNVQLFVCYSCHDQVGYIQPFRLYWEVDDWGWSTVPAGSSACVGPSAAVHVRPR
jgi:hypothetical protein